MKTFAFTDLVGSAELKSHMPGLTQREKDQAYIETILSPHREIIERELERFGGVLVKGMGDGHLVLFEAEDISKAAYWAIAVQKAHEQQKFRTGENETELAVKIAIDLGAANPHPNDPNDYIGRSVDFASRLEELASPGQILVSQTVQVLIAGDRIGDVTFHDHGEFDIPGIGVQRVYELLPAGRSPRSPKAAPIEATKFFPERAEKQSKGIATRVRPEPSRVKVGESLDKYLLLNDLGEGGMGELFLAKHVAFMRYAVVKVIRDELLKSDDPTLIERFYQEIRAASRLNHENLVRLEHSSAPDDFVHYLVMEFLDGLSVDKILDLSRVSQAGACEIVRQAAVGLQYLHEHNVVHRDIKPSNLMVVKNALGRPVVKILDFGLAMIADDDQRVTKFRATGMGTAMYMAPEQWKSTDVDVRADIYALGCTLYHLISGKPPFHHSENSPQYAHERETPPPLTSIPKPLTRVLTRMLAKRPENRYAEPGQVAADLAPLARTDALSNEFDQAILLGSHRLPPLVPRSPTPGIVDDTVNQGNGNTLPEPKSRRSLTHWQQVLRYPLRPVPGSMVALLGVVLALYLLWPARQLPPAASRCTLTLPGVHGQWWFYEYPWFFPRAREALVEHLTYEEYQALQSELTGGELDAFVDRLHDQTERAIEQHLPTKYLLLFRRLHVNPQSRTTQMQDELQSLCTFVSNLSEGGQMHPGDLHLLALLEAKLEENSGIEGRVPVTNRLSAAQIGYEKRKESWRDGLVALCQTDWAKIHLERRYTPGTVQLLRDSQIATSDGTEAAHFECYRMGLLVEATNDDPDIGNREKTGQLEEAAAYVQDPHSPLAGFVHYQLAHIYLDRLDFARALTHAQRSSQFFDDYFDVEAIRAKKSHGNPHAASNLFRSRQFEAMALHFSGKVADPEEAALPAWDYLLAAATDVNIQDALPNKELIYMTPNLYARRGDSRLLLTEEAREAAADYELAAQLGVSKAAFREKPDKFPYLIRIRCKASLAYSLAGDPAAATRSYELALAELDRFKNRFPEDAKRPTAAKVYRMYREVAEALLDGQDDPYPRLSALLDELEGRYDKDRLHRDDRQLLLFVCAYLQASNHADEIRLASLNNIFAGLAQVLNGGSGHAASLYLGGIQDAAKTYYRNHQ